MVLKLEKLNFCQKPPFEPFFTKVLSRGPSFGKLEKRQRPLSRALPLSALPSIFKQTSSPSTPHLQPTAPLSKPPFAL